MADLDLLPAATRTALTIKLDGYVEACVALARLGEQAAQGVASASSIAALGLSWFVVGVSSRLSVSRLA